MKAAILLSLFVASCFANSIGDDIQITTFEGIESRIANGQIGKAIQFPYQVRLQLTKNSNGRMVSSLCGGAILSNRTIITAAHCLKGATSGMAFMGISTQYSNERTRVMQGLWSRDFIVHERYNGTSMENDIALIHLKTTFKFNEAVKPINLPRASQINLDNRMGVISGFGKTGTNATASNELRFANRRILPAASCTKFYKSFFRSNMNVCCDGSQNISTCPGDSGGPLAIQEADGSKTLIGLTSYGTITCDTGFPTVFTRVSAHLAWINKHTGLAIRN